MIGKNQGVLKDLNRFIRIKSIEGFISDIGTLLSFFNINMKENNFYEEC